MLVYLKNLLENRHVPFTICVDTHAQVAQFFDSLEKITPSKMLEIHRQMLNDLSFKNFEPVSVEDLKLLLLLQKKLHFQTTLQINYRLFMD